MCDWVTGELRFSNLSVNVRVWLLRSSFSSNVPVPLLQNGARFGVQGADFVETRDERPELLPVPVLRAHRRDVTPAAATNIPINIART